MPPPATTTSQEWLIKPSHVVYALFAYVAYRLLYRIIIRPYFVTSLRKLPGPPQGNPLIGQFLRLSTEEIGIPQREWAKEYGATVRVTGPLGLERVMCLKPETLHQVLVSDWLYYPRPSYLRKILGLITGYGLLTVTGDDHRQMRKAMNPAFSLSNLVAQFPLYYDAIDGLVSILKEQLNQVDDPAAGKEVRVYEWMSKVTLDIICETAFGYKADSLHNPHNDLAEAYEELLSIQSGPNLAKLILFVSIPGGHRFLASDWAYNHLHWIKRISRTATKLVGSMYRIRKISQAMLDQKLNESVLLTNDMDAKKDIMSILVRARKAELDGGKGQYTMSDQAMMDQVLTFLGAGHETTASGLTWTLWHLANNLEVQQRLRDELAPAFKEKVHPDYRTLKEWRFLDCVVMESLRVMPPVPITVRVAKKTEYLDGVVVPKGTFIDIPIRVVNTWKETWGDDAEVFKPSRWLNLPKSYNSTYSMMPFIAGPHACIGKTMAIVEMKAVLASLIVNFEFEPAFDGQAPKPAAAITVKPTDGMPLCIRRVSSPPATPVNFSDSE